MDEELVIAVIFRIYLVVALKHVEVNKIANCVVDGFVATMHIVLVFEVGGLWAVAKNVIRDDFSGCFREIDQPLFSCAFVHGLIVLPVHITSIKVVVQNKLAELSAAHRRILTCRCRELTISKSTHHYLNTVCIVNALNLLLDLLSAVSERIALRKICPCTSPNHSHILWTARTTPESQNYNVVVMRSSIAWNSESFGNRVTVP
jgi:hypothetical protein